MLADTGCFGAGGLRSGCEADTGQALRVVSRSGQAARGLRLDTAAAAIRGDGGSAVVPGKSGQSLLIEAVLGGDDLERMPLKRPPLSDPQIAVLKAWIDQEAQAPPGETPTRFARSIGRSRLPYDPNRLKFRDATGVKTRSTASFSRGSNARSSSLRPRPIGSP